uniref:Uncharacterized protein n=1 Tax=Anguilla anguilla TaxID=7936 RepID=A0A0E9VZZ8_ANGAN
MLSQTQAAVANQSFTFFKIFLTPTVKT